MLGKIPAARLALIEKIVTEATRSLARARHALAADFVRAFFPGVVQFQNINPTRAVIRAHTERKKTWPTTSPTSV